MQACLSGRLPVAGDKKYASSLFCVGRLNRTVICIPIVVTHSRRRGVLTELIHNYSILTVNQPRGIFSGGGWASHMGVWGRIATTKCIRFINPTHTRQRRTWKKSMCCSLEDPARSRNGTAAVYHFPGFQSRVTAGSIAGIRPMSRFRGNLQ